MRNFVFVYGSLKEGFGNHARLLGRATKVGEGITRRAEYLMRSMGGFPGVYHGVGEQAIWGEVYEVDRYQMAGLDRLEGHPFLYRRTEHDISLAEGGTVSAWMYLLPKDDMKRFEGHTKFNCERVEVFDLDGTEIANWLPKNHYYRNW